MPSKLLPGRRPGKGLSQRSQFLLLLNLWTMYLATANSYPAFQRLLVRNNKRRLVLPTENLRYRLISSCSINYKKANAWKLNNEKVASEHQDPSRGKTNVTIAHSNSITSSNTPVAGQNESSSVSNSTSWSLTPYVGRSILKAAGRVVSVLGFLASSSTALVTDKAHFRRMKANVEAFKNFLKTSDISLEISPSLNRHLLRDIVVLSRAQKILASRSDPRDMAKAKKKLDIPSKEEALRYMRYSTAVYGNNMIIAAEMDVKGKFDTRLSPLTRTRISEHIGLPEDDIVLINVDYGGDGHHLRHFVAIDHVHQKVVLAIRGTFNLNEVVVDIASFSRPCFGGEAHSEMYTMAERVWNSAGSTVLDLLRRNEDYEFIITGHSLGAGTACILNIMCQKHQNSLVDGRKVHCFAYAAPPVFTPLELIPQAVQSTTNYILGKDAVPFLSVDSVRHIFSCVRVIEDHLKSLSRTARFKLTAGLEDPSEELIQAVLEASRKRLKPKQGAPVLAIPAAATVWMRELETGDYDFQVCDPDLLSITGITIDLNMLDDHLPSRYEHALENLNHDLDFDYK